MEKNEMRGKVGILCAVIVSILATYYGVVKAYVTYLMGETYVMGYGIAFGIIAPLLIGIFLSLSVVLTRGYFYRKVWIIISIVNLAIGCWGISTLDTRYGKMNFLIFGFYLILCLVKSDK